MSGIVRGVAAMSASALQALLPPGLSEGLDSGVEGVS